MVRAVRRISSLGMAIALIGACADPEQRGAGSTQRAGDTPAIATPPAPPAADDSTLGPDGWGPLRIGMSRAEIVAAAGEDANPNAVGGPEPEVCEQFRPVRAPAGMLVMVQRDRLTRISIAGIARVKSDRGIGIGDPAAAVDSAYGASAITSGHAYQESPAAYITIWSDTAAATARGIRYEIGGDGRVSHIHAGGRSIAFVEGCA